MIISRIKLKNWKNFPNVDVNLIDDVNYVLGRNATGKSNFLDVFRFLRDLCKNEGGGLQKAIKDRGGISKLRCLHARSNSDILIEFDLTNEKEKWTYSIEFNQKNKEKYPTIISERIVHSERGEILSRPNQEDKLDPERMTQSVLQQVNSNKDFRDIVSFCQDIIYLHLVPQFLKYSEQNLMQNEEDPFGMGFLKVIASTPKRTRDSRFKKISNQISKFIPYFKEIKYIEELGIPHLQATYQHHRPNGAKQLEDQFSDGTLRMIGLLWCLTSNETLILLEEPELSLDEEVVSLIPEMINKILKGKKKQVIITTHSNSMLENKGIDSNGVLILEQSNGGTSISKIPEIQQIAINEGLSIAEVVMPNLQQLPLFNAQ